MNNDKTDFFAQSEKLLKLLLEKEPTSIQISLLALKLKQTYENGVSAYSQ